MKTYLWVPVVAIGFLSACGDSEEALSAASVPPTPTYGDVAAIVQSRCGVCHVGGGVEPALGGYATFRSQAITCLDLMDKGEMPPGGPMVPAYERELIANWIQQGMPQ